MRVCLSEVLAALSHALDLTEGQPAGHTVRTCIVGMRIADEIGMGITEKAALYNALLLKDTGCSSNAAEMSRVFGTDDRIAKPRMKQADWDSRLALAVEAARTVAKGLGFSAKIRHLAGLAHAEDITCGLIRIRCERGAEIASKLGFPTATANAIRSLDEHWNGRGHPDGLSGEAIPIASRIMLIAQTVESVHNSSGIEAALRIAIERGGRWFDPSLVRIIESWKKDLRWWKALGSSDVTSTAVILEPAPSTRHVTDEGLDDVARAFAEIIDAKSPYTFSHSTRVASITKAIGQQLGYDATQLRTIERASLLHDIGKLGVSSLILEKPSALTPPERAEVERHPVYTWEILRRVGAFAGFARMAAFHHEKLDGSGYPWRVIGADLDEPSRILCVADIYEALTTDRPYRAGMTRDAALRIIRSDAGTKLCPTAIDALAVVTVKRELLAS